MNIVIDSSSGWESSLFGAKKNQEHIFISRETVKANSDSENIVQDFETTASD